MDRDNKVVIDINDPSVFMQHQDPIAYDETAEPEAERVLTPEEQAANILEAAKREAEAIVNDAKAAGIAEQAALRNAAKSDIQVQLEQAKSQGYQEGITIATREGDGIRAQARQVLADAEAEHMAMRAKLEPEMVGLLLRILDKLVGSAVALNPDIILYLVRAGIQNTTITGDVVIYVSPDDHENVTAKKNEIMALTDGSVKLEIKKDLSLNAMDCVIETPFGNIDCSLGQQYEALRQNITYLLNSSA
jgi:flagellar assembly protein FliH